MSLKTVLRALFYNAILGSWYTFSAYKSTIAVTFLAALSSFLTYFFLGSSIELQRGIQDYGTQNAVAFMLSGLFLSQLANPFRHNFNLHLNSFYYSFSRPISPYLLLIEDWLSIYLKFNVFPVLIYAVAIIFSQNLNVRLCSLVVFVILWILMNVGLNFLENGIVYFTKRAEPVKLTFRFIEYVFSGQYFPLTVLPAFLQQSVWLLPFSWAYMVWRKVLFQGLSILSTEYLVYFVASILTLMVGLYFFKKGYDKIYREGLVL